MIVDSLLVNAKAYLKGHLVDCCIAIEEGTIAKIGKETQMPQADEKTLDVFAAHRVVSGGAPGLGRRGRR